MNSLGTETNFPLAQLTTSNDILHPGDIVTGYSISPSSGNTVILKFTTALSGHNHFELQYSKDNINWAVYKTIPGDNLFQHQTTFTKPASQGGTIYGRIALFDMDNNMSVTPGRIIAAADPAVTGINNNNITPVTSLNVYPNPSTANVNFDLKNYSGNTFTITLTDLYGKQLGKKTFTANSAERYILQSNASTGTYILNIIGNGLIKSVRVMIQ